MNPMRNQLMQHFKMFLLIGVIEYQKYGKYNILNENM